MIRLLIVLLSLTLLQVTLQAQRLSIFQALHLNEAPDFKSRTPKKVVETITQYDANGGKKIEKVVQYFDNAGMVSKGEIYGEQDRLDALLTFTNDTMNKIILTKVVEMWIEEESLKESTAYTYDKNHFLVGATDKNAQGNILRQIKIICNEKGHPIELSLQDNNGKVYLTEKATYFYNNNKVVKAIESADGTKIEAADSAKIVTSLASKFPFANEVYNSQGDLINWSIRMMPGFETLYEQTYTYDNLGNWVESKIYRLVNERGGEQKRVLEQLIGKEFFY